MGHRTRHRGATGLTLIETVLAITLLTLLMGSLFQFYALCLRSREMGHTTTKQALLARVILNQLAGEIRQAVSTQFDSAVKGGRREIWLLTSSLPSRELHEIRSITEDILPGEHDVRRLIYRLHSTEEVLTEDGEPRVLGLVRAEQKTLNDPQLFQTSTEEDEEGEERAVRLYAPEIKYIEFRYSTGSRGEWLTRWQGSGIPKAIRITVGFVQEPGMIDSLSDESDIGVEEEEDDTPHPDRYTMQVWLATATSTVGNVLSQPRDTDEEASP